AKTALAVALAALLGACARPPPHRSDALARSAALLARADKLEAELHAQVAELDLYGELGARRQSASELLCKMNGRHLGEIKRLAEAQREKRKARKNRHVALLQKDASARP